MYSGSGDAISPSVSLDDALERHDLEGFRQRLQSGADPQAIRLLDAHLPSLLHRIVQAQRMDFLAQLASSSPPLLPNDRGETPLHLAAVQSATTATVMLLVSTYGADRAVTCEGQTFLHYLLRNEIMPAAVLSELLEWILRRSDAEELLNEQDLRGKTVFDYALFHRRREPSIIRLLLRYDSMGGNEMFQCRKISLQTDEEIHRSLLVDCEIKHREYFDRGAATEEKQIYKFLRRVRRLKTKAAKTRDALEQEEEFQRWQLSCFVMQLHQLALRRSVSVEEDNHFKFLRNCSRVYVEAVASLQCHRMEELVEFCVLLQQEHIDAAVVSCQIIEKDEERQFLFFSESFNISRKALDAKYNVMAEEAESFGDLKSMWVIGLEQVCQAEEEAVKDRAVSLVQRVGRGYNGRIDLYQRLRPKLEVLLEEMARRNATDRLQRAGRGYLGRREISQLQHRDRVELYDLPQEQLDSQTHAAELVQRAGRGYLSRFSMTKSPPNRTDVECPLLVRAETLEGVEWNAETIEKETVDEDTAVKNELNRDKLPSLHIIQAFLATRQARLDFMRRRFAVKRIEFFWVGSKNKKWVATVPPPQDTSSSVLSEGTRRRAYLEKIQRTTRAVTKLLWRENFCCQMTVLLSQAKLRRAPVQPRRTPLWEHFREYQKRMERFLLLEQFLVSVGELVYMGIIPRTSRTAAVHRDIDTFLSSFQIVVALLLPPSVPSFLDLVVAVIALSCCVVDSYGGVVAITLYALKYPFVVKAFKSDHPGSNTYCRAVQNVAFYLMILSPLLFAMTGGIIRFSTRNDLLLTSDGSVGSVFYYLFSTVAAQLHLLALHPGTVHSSMVPKALWRMINTKDEYQVSDTTQLISVELPLFSLMLFRMSLSIYLWTAAIVGTHTAIKTHYDISDRTKLKRNKLRFRSHQESEPLDAHRAANIEILGDVLDGAMMENDVQSAKEAIDASYNFGKGVGRYSQRLTAQTENLVYHRKQRKSVSQVPPVTLPLNCRTWDCRKEDPRSAGAFDTNVFEVALGKIDQKGRLETFVERQLTGHFFRRESTYVLLAMIILESIFPNTYAMECTFGAILLMEFLVTIYVLDLEVLCMSALHLAVRVMSFSVGLIPVAIPLAGLRVFRLFEGWSGVFRMSGMILWDLGYCLITFLTVWMIAFVASLQNLENPDSESICGSRKACLAISLREVVLSAWTESLFRTKEEGPLMVFMILFFQLIFIPFFLTFLLHPLLRLSSFIGRFLRLVIQALHKDLVDYLKHYLEGDSWYSHWRFYEPVPANCIVTLKLWASACRGSFHRPFLQSISRYYTLSRVELNEEEKEFTPLTEVISSGRFASFSDCYPPSKTMNQGLKGLFCLRRSFIFAYVSVGINISSLILLFFITPWGTPNIALITFTAFVHLLSIVVDVINVPLDLTAVLTGISTFTLLFSTVLLVIPVDGLTELYELRFISLIRIIQLNVYPFSAVRFFLKPYVLSLVSILLPTLAIGVLVYTAELLRAQLYLMSHRNTYKTTNTSTLTYAQQVASRKWRQSYPNTEDVRDLFVFYFSDNAHIYYTIFNQWLMPTMCIATCLAYLFWSGSNFMDSNLLLIELIPFLEDPITTARFDGHYAYWRFIGHSSLVFSLIFNCVVSPLTTMSHVDGHSFYFGMEIVFTSIGLLHAFYSLRSAMHRCIRSSDNLHFQRQKFSLLVLVAEAIMLASVIVELLYYSLVLPLAISLLSDPSSCTIQKEAYATYFVSFRFLFLLQLLPRPLFLYFLKDFLLYLYGTVVMVLFFIGATSAIADVSVLRLKLDSSFHLWLEAFRSFLRSTFTYSIPIIDSSATWAPFNATRTFEEFQSKGLSYEVITSDFSMSLMMLLLTVAGKVVSASSAGFFIAISLAPLSTLFQSPLPAKSQRLYWALSGGVSRIVDCGMKLHDDLKPEVREGVQTRKFTRIYNSYGIPFWSIPHLLEELNICRPSRQRRFMFSLEQLLVYLPISEERREKVNEFMMLLDIFRGGGPTKLSFEQLPTYPPLHPAPLSENPYTSNTTEIETSPYIRFVSPLRLVQAIALFELSFPTDSSVKTKHWIEFVSVAQKIRAATLLQSLWRMYADEMLFDEERSEEDRSTIENLRRSFRRMRIKENAKFRLHSSFADALRHECCTFNPGSDHADVLNRLQNHYASISPGSESA